VVRVSGGIGDLTQEVAVPVDLDDTTAGHDGIACVWARKQIETAILEGLALADEMGRHAEVIESADRYLELYPTSPKVGEIRQKRTAATLKLAAEVAPTAPEQAAPAP